MRIVHLYRPLLLLLLPVGLLLIAAALMISMAFEIRNLPLLLLGFGLAGGALWVIHRWAAQRVEIYGSWTYNGQVFAPILVQHRGVFTRTEHSIALIDLTEVTITRPLLWSWCDGARISLAFTDQQRLELGLVDNAGPAVELLHTALQLNRRHGWSRP